MDNSDHYTIGLESSLTMNNIINQIELEHQYSEIYKFLVERLKGLQITRQYMFTPHHGLGIRIKSLENHSNALNKALLRFDYQVHPNISKTEHYIFYEIVKMD
jgi:hypothetical protein